MYFLLFRRGEFDFPFAFCARQESDAGAQKAFSLRGKSINRGVIAGGEHLLMLKTSAIWFTVFFVKGVCVPLRF